MRYLIIMEDGYIYKTPRLMDSMRKSVYAGTVEVIDLEYLEVLSQNEEVDEWESIDQFPAEWLECDLHT